MKNQQQINNQQKHNGIQFCCVCDDCISLNIFCHCKTVEISQPKSRILIVVYVSLFSTVYNTQNLRRNKNWTRKTKKNHTPTLKWALSIVKYVVNDRETKRIHEKPIWINWKIDIPKKSNCRLIGVRSTFDATTNHPSSSTIHNRII